MYLQVFRDGTDMSGQVGPGMDSARPFWYRSGRFWTCRDRLGHVVTGPSVSGHVRSDWFRWGHVGTGCSGRTVHIGTGLDRTGQFGTRRDRPGHVWTCQNRSVQVRICWYTSFGTGRTCRDRSAQVWTRRDNSGTVRDVSGHDETCWYRS
jgi:hypothetical protein